MTIKYKDKEYSLPCSLSQITLKQWIEWKELYGYELEASNKMIDEMPDTSEKDVEAFLLLSDSACKLFSFFTGIDLVEVMEEIEIQQLINLYTSHSQLILSDQEQLDIGPLYLFKDEVWKIAPPVENIENGGLYYNSFKILKSMFFDFKAFSGGDWSRLPKLCAFYFHKVEEKPDEALSKVEDRKALMDELPLDVALTIAKYLNDTLHMFTDLVKADKIALS